MKPPFGKLYPMSTPELEALSEYLNNNLFRDLIKSNDSEAEAPVLFVKKSDTSLRFFVEKQLWG